MKDTDRSRNRRTGDVKLPSPGFYTESSGSPFRAKVRVHAGCRSTAAAVLRTAGPSSTATGNTSKRCATLKSVRTSLTIEAPALIHSAVNNHMSDEEGSTVPTVDQVFCSRCCLIVS